MPSNKQLLTKVSEICVASLQGNVSPREAVGKCLSRAYAAVKAAHLGGASGATVCMANAFMIDSVIKYLHEIFLARREGKSRNIGGKFCIVALGGYGRRELCPKSDIDILFLYDENVSDRLKTTVADEILYPLWDTGLKLGHSSRTRREAVADARKDILLRNAMLDIRFICGNEKIYEKFLARFSVMCDSYKMQHFDELMRLKRDRHSKYGWTPYLQEPNIKNGIGGLRDAQTMAWKTALNFGSANIRELAARKIISLSEYKAVRKAYDFLLRVRNDMHYIFGRENDLLDIETQMKVANNLGYPQKDDNERVEFFMRDVYFSFRVIDTIAKTARKRMGLTLPTDVVENMRHMGMRLPGNKKFNIDGFSIYRGEVNALWSTVFAKNPKRLIRIFSYFQEYGAAPSDSLEVLIKDHQHLIDSSVRNDTKTNAIFLSMLQNRGNVFPTLEMMHYWGVLGRFIQEFGDVTCMVQHEFYHRYTIDVHTLNTIAQLDKIFCAGPADGLYWEYHKILVSAPSPILLYLMLFLHDIGKGDGIRGHSEISADIAERILHRLGVPDSDIEPILFVIRNHLQMARFWQSYDVEDEASHEKFATIVGNEEQLKYLYILTFCDGMGTAEGFWNSYKQGLHIALYKGTLAVLQKGQAERADSYEARKAKVLKEALADPKSNGMEAFIQRQAKKLPQNYFLYHGRNDLIMHIGMIRQLQKNRRDKKDDNRPIIEWRDEPNRSITRLYVVSMDRHGLFAILAGVVTLSGMDILGSKILTSSAGVTLDAFYVTGITGGIGGNMRIRKSFASVVESAISGKISLDDEVDDMFYSREKRRGDKVIKDVFMRRESGKIILEIRARDRIGLLYKIARAIDSCGYDITFARVNTEQNWAQDSFHLESMASALKPELLLDTLENLV